MINITNALLNKWEGKIVYMPNGGGKTTSSLFIQQELEKNSPKVGLFTRKSLENLIAVGNSKPYEIYFGLDAIKIAKRDRLLEEIKKTAPLSKYVKSSFSETSANRAREKSFYCAYFAFKNLNEVPKRFKKGKNLIDVDFEQDGIAKEFDSILRLDIYNAINSLINSFEDKDQLLVGWDVNSEIPGDYYDEIMDLYLYCVTFKVKTCLLCGHKYRSPKVLKEKMDNHINGLAFLDDMPFAGRVLEIANDVYASAKESSVLKPIFPSEEKSVKKCFRDLKLYKRICELTLYHIGKTLTDVETSNGNTVFDCLCELERLEKAISSRLTNKKRIERFNNYLISQIKKIIYLPEEIKIEPLQDGFGLSFKIKNKKVNPYEILSESESKRFALVALRAEIRFGSIDSLILDDPVDSYDDYNKLICIDYISSFYKTTRIKHLFVLTNDFETVFRLSKKCNKNVIFYLPDFDNRLGGQGVNTYIEKECNSKEVDLISRNEVFYFAQLIGEKQTKPYDYEMLLTALILSCRNFNDELLRKLTRVIINRGSASCVIHDAAWNNEMKNRIVMRLEHFIPSFADPLFHSYSVTFGDVSDCFSRLAICRTSFPASRISDNRLFCDVRDSLCSAAYVNTSSDYATIINYISKKLIIVSQAKFQLEEKLINLIENNYGQTYAAMVLNTKMLGPKIATALSIDAANGGLITNRLKRIESIHEKYSVLYNLFDHGLIQQISPYLPASTRDISNFYFDVKNV